MTKKEKIEKAAYMILQDIAFLYANSTDNKPILVAVNLKNIAQKVTFQLRGNDLLFCESNMSKENTYKTMLIVERNKIRLSEGMRKWGSTQGKK